MSNHSGDSYQSIGLHDFDSDPALPQKHAGNRKMQMGENPSHPCRAPILPVNVCSKWYTCGPPHVLNFPPVCKQEGFPPKPNDVFFRHHKTRRGLLDPRRCMGGPITWQERGYSSQQMCTAASPSGLLGGKTKKPQKPPISDFEQDNHLDDSDDEKHKESKTDHADGNKRKASKAVHADDKKRKASASSHADINKPKASKTDDADDKKRKASKTDHADDKKRKASKTDHADDKKRKASKTDVADDKNRKASKPDHADDKKRKASKTDHADDKKSKDSKADHPDDKKRKASKTDHADDQKGKAPKTDKAENKGKNKKK